MARGTAFEVLSPRPWDHAPPAAVPSWLPPGKEAAVCLALDDVHPGSSADPYEAGGDLSAGVLGRLEELLTAHPQLRATLYVTADWRLISAWPERPWLRWLPGLSEQVFHARVRPQGEMQLDRHPRFVTYLRSLPRVEVALHGLHHVRSGPALTREYRGQSRYQCRASLERSFHIFRRAGLEPVPGLAPPGWELSAQLAAAAADAGLQFVASARDLETPVSPAALTARSGLTGVSLLYPQPILDGRLLHLTTNFQATSRRDRAFQIIEHGGLLSIKAHAVKDVAGHIMADGLDELYRNYLDSLLDELERRYGEALWWTSAGEIARRLSSPPA